MKTIVVATDFSVSAEQATLYAATLARQLKASVSLLHVYQMPVSMSDFPVLLISAEDLKKNADEGLRRAKEAAQKASPNVVFETESRLGDVLTEIDDYCKDKEVLALVAGTKNLTGFEQFLLGNTASSIVRHSHLPVIIVPEGAAPTFPRKIALAVEADDRIPAEKIKTVVDLLGAELHIVHIQTGGEETPIALPAVLQHLSYNVYKDEDVSKGLAQFIASKNIDLLLILPRKHSLMQRIFSTSHTDELINEMAIPVMCIQEPESDS